MNINKRVTLPHRFWNFLGATFRGCVIFLSVQIIFGCATTPDETGVQPVFYPPLPNPPRIQYLASFSGEHDLGDQLSRFGQFVLGDDQDQTATVQKPYGVAIHDGKIYVVDTRGNGYAIFDLRNKSFKFIRRTGPGFLKKPINIEIESDGTKYITDTERKQVVVFDRDDYYIRAYGKEKQFNPSDVAVVGDRIYVVDLEHHNVHVLNKYSGETLFAFPSPGSEKGKLFFPTNIVVKHGNVYVTDTGNSRIQKYALTGEYIDTIGGLGAEPGTFTRPKGIDVDEAGRLLVIDAAFENVQVFDKQGKLLLFFGEPGGAPENINLPTSIVVDYKNVNLFQPYAAADFRLEYVILVASQFGKSKINAYGMGKMEGWDYSLTESK